MARGINKVILVGNLGNEPESRYTQAGAAITNITVATSESWKDKNTGQAQERTEWHRVVFFNKLAEIAGQYLHKGSKVYIEGALRTRKWQDQSGQDRYTTEIVANEMQMLDSRGASVGTDAPPVPPSMNVGNAGAQGGMSNPYGAPIQTAPVQAAALQTQHSTPNYQPRQQPMQQAPAQHQPMQQAPVQQPIQQPAAAPAFDSFDDDIPF